MLGKGSRMTGKKPMPVKIVAGNEKVSATRYWQERTPEERLEAVTFLNEQCWRAQHGDTPFPRLVRVLRVVGRFK